MKNGVPFLDSDLNMNIHALEGAVATFVFEDEVGNARDMSDATVSFEVEGFSKALTNGSEDHHMILTLQVDELDAYLNKSQPYVILDSSGSVPHVIIEGNLRVYGWT